MRSNLVDLTLHKHFQTAKAILVSGTGDKDDAVWVPLSQCEIEETSKPHIIVVTMEEWLAKEKELI